MTGPASAANVDRVNAERAAAEPRSFETLLDRLEKIVQRLESNELTLEEAIQAYQEGVTLAKLGHDRLQDAERRIEEVTRDGKARTVDPQQILREEP